MARVLALLGVGVVPADTPVLRADDLGVLRGDGVFETMHVRGGQPWLLDRHLDRMSRSAALLAIPLPDRAALVELAGQACAAWPAADEAALRLVCTRGPEDGGPVTVYATVAPLAPAAVEARHTGVSVATATLAVPAEARPGAPWLLGGAKTLSYAVNMASLRWAAEQGVNEVLWTSADGYALEAPTATLVWLAGGVLYTVPAATTGILAGTTAAYLLEHAGELGMRAAERLVRPAELHSADGVWLASSVRGLTEVRTLDGVALGPSPETERMQKLLGYL
ncbi:aminotransferase IV [Planosporangium thailandense]|uniref:Aminotransferase IV n=1 Tax=Planosporangium thailandense TaxID=765197 RepID=A0ABX0XTG4_9ACTN|nr:aminotransferase class IV [Planosporangium thailandense]NJC69285.1 aminotransferase IV [Planosporangium thailandense]